MVCCESGAWRKLRRRGAFGHPACLLDKPLPSPGYALRLASARPGMRIAHYGLQREGQGWGLTAGPPIFSREDPAVDMATNPLFRKEDGFVKRPPSHVITAMGLSPGSKRPAAVARR